MVAAEERVGLKTMTEGTIKACLVGCSLCKYWYEHLKKADWKVKKFERRLCNQEKVLKQLYRLEDALILYLSQFGPDISNKRDIIKLGLEFYEESTNRLNGWDLNANYDSAMDRAYTWHNYYAHVNLPFLGDLWMDLNEAYHEIHLDMDFAVDLLEEARFDFEGHCDLYVIELKTGDGILL